MKKHIDKMKNFKDHIKEFFPLSLCYLIMVFILKTIEIFFIAGFANINSFNGFIFGNIISCCFISFIVFVIHSSVALFSKKSAVLISSLLFAIMVILESGLIFYHKTTGILMGNEIITRPLWEIIFTIKAALNFWIVTPTILFISFFTFALIKISKKEVHSVISYIMITLMLISIPLFLIKKPKQDRNIVNKIWYCVNSCLNNNMGYTFIGNDNDAKLLRRKYNQTLVNNYKRFFPDREIIDNKYPLERNDNANNVLGPYFKKSEEKPNIVIIIVESLGSDLFGQNKYGVSFTPFLDSLSKHSLLWTNCISTTGRSFGAIPAITASVPHGKKGFQFGNIPEHNSLFSILKDNYYYTSSFYAGDYSFDKIYDYLIAQKIDFMSNFYLESKNKNHRKTDKLYWGFHDRVMFEKSMDYIKERSKDSSYFDLFTTISQHENYLKLHDKNKEKYYHDRVNTIISSLPEEKQGEMNKIQGFLASTLYGDDAIRYFFNSYNEYYKDKNTIFVITGDHSLNLNKDNPINAHHVPLIIWSNNLIKPQHFKSVVSHNDIAPSLTHLLRDNYKINTPKNIHWIGDELDSCKEFRSNVRTYFLGYTRKKNMCIYEDFLYLDGDKTQIFKINDSLILEEINDPKITKNMKKYQETMTYIDEYTYSNNKITMNPIYSQNTFSVIESVSIDSVYCASKEEKPSVSSPVPVSIYSTTIDSIFSEIKIVMTADLKYTGKVWQDTFINIGIKFNDNNGQKMTFTDNLAKNITRSSYYPDLWTSIELIKTYEINEHSDTLNFEIFMQAPHKDYQWDPEHSVTLKNIKISFLGSNR